jgi:hypothetical protein
MGNFPEDGFRKESFRERLSRGFNTRAYGRDDVLGIRTATHYGNIRSEGAHVHTDIDCAIATKMTDGSFLVTRYHAVQTSHVGKKYGGMLKIDGSDVSSVTCGADEVLDVMDRIDAELAAKAVYSVMMPELSIVRMHDAVPLPVAKALFEEPATYEDIETQIQFLDWQPLVDRIRADGRRLDSPG